VRVVITLVGVNIVLSVWKSHSECKNHTCAGHNYNRSCPNHTHSCVLKIQHVLAKIYINICMHACEFHKGRYLILSDSKSSIRAMESRKISLHTHPFVYECKQKCWQLTRSSGREVGFMRVPASHVGIAENERTDFKMRQATLGNMVYNAQSVARDLLPVAKQRMAEKLGSR
jgi:hypothetical protein